MRKETDLLDFRGCRPLCWFFELLCVRKLWSLCEWNSAYFSKYRLSLSFDCKVDVLPIQMLQCRHLDFISNVSSPSSCQLKCNYSFYWSTYVQWSLIPKVHKKSHSFWLQYFLCFCYVCEFYLKKKNKIWIINLSPKVIFWYALVCFSQSICLWRFWWCWWWYCADYLTSASAQTLAVWN